MIARDQLGLRHVEARSVRPRGRAGVVLLVVLIVVALAVLAGTAVLHAARAEAAANAASLRRTQARALAWSGVQGVMAQLANQRDAILAGEEPILTREWTLFGEGESVRGIVRLIGFDEFGQSLVESESAKLDVNTATEDMLSNVPGLSSEVASKIVEARARRMFGSVDELRAIEGIDGQGLAAGTEDAPENARGRLGSDTNDSGLDGYLTAWSFDPNIQAGIGAGGDASRGDLRVNLGAGWSDSLEPGIRKRFGDDAVNGVRTIMQRGTQFKRDGDLVAALRQFNVEPKDWAPILDCFTTTADPYRLGRVDLNRASVEVLACVPGIDADAAASIVAMRDSLDAQTRLDVAWPAAREILTPEAFAQAVDHLTTHSAQWRVRIESGIVEGAGDWRREPTEITLRDRIVLDVVIDIASQRPRVAYLRDVTMLEAAGAVAEFRMASVREAADPIDLAMPDVTDVPIPPVEEIARTPARSRESSPARSRAGSPAREPDRGERQPEASDGAAQTNEPPAGQDRRRGRWTTTGAQP